MLKFSPCVFLLSQIICRFGELLFYFTKGYFEIYFQGTTKRYIPPYPVFLMFILDMFNFIEVWYAKLNKYNIYYHRNILKAQILLRKGQKGCFDTWLTCITFFPLGRSRGKTQENKADVSIGTVNQTQEIAEVSQQNPC